MDLLTAYAFYMTGVILLVGLWAARVPHENIRTVFALSLVWPVSVLAIIGMLLLSITGWEMDVAKSAKVVGFRKSTNPKMRGIAVAVLGTELQFYSPRKTVDQ